MGIVVYLNIGDPQLLMPTIVVDILPTGWQAFSSLHSQPP